MKDKINYIKYTIILILSKELITNYVMTAIIPELKLIFVSIPKCACTSLKNCMFFLENKYEYKPIKNNGKILDIHRLYPSMYFDKLKKKLENTSYDISDYTKICLIRDPIKRFVSAYTNRVNHHKELSKKVIEENDLDPSMANPTFIKFVKHYYLYKNVRSIKHHTDHMYKFIGDNPSYFDKVFNINNINEISDFLKKQYGIEYKIPRLQTGGGGSESIDLEDIKEKRPNIYKRIEQITSQDYKIFSQYLK